MTTIGYIFIHLILAAVFCIAMVIFIQASGEFLKDAKEDIIRWFHSTKIGMNYFNKKNGVTILSEEEYNDLLMSGKIIPIEVVEE